MTFRRRSRCAIPSPSAPRRERVAALLTVAWSLVLGALATSDPWAGALRAEPGAGTNLWIEAERADFQSVDRHPWWYDRVRREALFGGDWLSHFSQERPGQAEYEIEIGCATECALWVRANPVRTHLSYQLDGGSWTEIDLSRTEGDPVNIAEDGARDLRFIAWVRVAGKLALDAGMHRLAFKMHGEGEQHGGIDCFVLAPGEFKPGDPPPPPAAPGGKDSKRSKRASGK